MKTGFKYLAILIIAAIVLGGVLPVILGPKDPYAFGNAFGKFMLVYLGIPVFIFGAWVQSKRKKQPKIEVDEKK